MANELRILWGAAVNVGTVTNLESLADGNIWKSGKLDLPNDPSDQLLRIFYKLVMAATPANNDSYAFRIAFGDEHASEIWPGAISESEEEVSTAANIEDIKQALEIVHTHIWRTGQNVTLQGHFDVWVPSADFQILIEAGGHALSTGNVIHYRVGTPQLQ